MAAGLLAGRRSARLASGGESAEPRTNEAGESDLGRDAAGLTREDGCGWHDTHGFDNRPATGNCAEARPDYGQHRGTGPVAPKRDEDAGRGGGEEGGQVVGLPGGGGKRDPGAPDREGERDTRQELGLGARLGAGLDDRSERCIAMRGAWPVARFDSRRSHSFQASTD
jgi:hypothetical protein